MRSLPATRRMKFTFGRLPSAPRGASASASTTLRKSAADTVTGKVHELKVSVPPVRFDIAVPVAIAMLLRSMWLDGKPASASMLKLAGLRKAVLLKKSMPPGW